MLVEVELAFISKLRHSLGAHRRFYVLVFSPLQTAGSLSNHKVSPRDVKPALKVTRQRAAAPAGVHAWLSPLFKTHSQQMCYLGEFLLRVAAAFVRPHTSQGEPPLLYHPETGGKWQGLPIG